MVRHAKLCGSTARVRHACQRRTYQRQQRGCPRRSQERAAHGSGDAKFGPDRIHFPICPRPRLPRHEIGLPKPLHEVSSPAEAACPRTPFPQGTVSPPRPPPSPCSESVRSGTALGLANAVVECVSPQVPVPAASFEPSPSISPRGTVPLPSTSTMSSAMFALAKAVIKPLLRQSLGPYVKDVRWAGGAIQTRRSLTRPPPAAARPHSCLWISSPARCVVIHPIPPENPV